MRIIRGIKRAPELGGIIVHDPGQVRYLRKWWSELKRSPIEANLPWLPFRIIDLLDDYLTPGSRVFEFGGGGSTLWFSKRAGEVVTVEHDTDWFPVLASAMEGKAGATVMHQSSADDYNGYVDSIAAYPDDHFDVVVVDGRERVRCFETAMPKVRPGGLLILDDTNRERYRPAFDLASGWKSKTYRGLTPSKSEAGVTTVWQRP